MGRRAPSYSERGLEFARGTAGNASHPRFVQLAAARLLGWFVTWADREDRRYNPDAVNVVGDFIERLPHVKGHWAGRSIRLEDWQCFLLCGIYGWQMLADDGATWVRVCREFNGELPRKNAKSTLAAALGLYHLTSDGESGAEVFCGATSRDQAMEVFRPARLMAERCPGFTEALGVTVGKQSISVAATGGRFEPVIGKPGDGSSPSFAIADECHEHTTSELVDTMSTGMAARLQPLLFRITTAGDNLAGPYYRRRDEVIKVLEGLREEESLFAVIWALDEGDNWEDFGVWAKANPNLGVSVMVDFLRKQHQIALTSTSRRNAILTKHLNLWQQSLSAWMDMPAWRRCQDALSKLECHRGETCYVAVDLAAKTDLAAVAILFEADGQVFAFGRWYCPEETAARPENEHYRQWATDGWLRLTPGATIDVDEIETQLLDLSTDYQVAEIVFDPWQATQIGQHLAAAGATVVELPNQLRNMSEPMKELEALVLSGRITIEADPCLAWMASNVVARVDTRDNVQPNKQFPENKIDGVVAMIMALNRLRSGTGGQYDGAVIEWV